MQKRTRKIIMLLAVVMLMTVCFAFGTKALDETGQCGDNVYWNFNSETGELVISGEGAMWDYFNSAIEINPFNNSSEIKCVVIEDGVTTIGASIFGGCTNLESVTMADSVTSIKFMAFARCYNLTDIKLSGNLEELGQQTFYFCKSLEKIILPDSMNDDGLKGLTFQYCINLKHVVLPKTLVLIGPYEFQACSSLESITVPSTVKKICRGAFDSCVRLKTITLPDGLKNIEDDVFFNCVSLEKTELPESLEEIGESAFELCTSLTAITIPELITEIKESTFQECLSLKEIILPENIENIYESSFESCLSLEKVTCENKDLIFNGKEIFHKEYALAEGVTIEEFIEKYKALAILGLSAYGALDNEEELERLEREYLKLEEEIEIYMVYLEESASVTDLVLHGHTHSTTETYATERNIPFVQLDETYHPDTYFADEWTYDYDNMIRYRECTFTNCDVKIEEPLESTENGDVEIIEPVDPDTDFEVDEIKGDNFIVVEETVVNGIEGNAEILRAFDITLKNKDGVHVQPDGTVKVKLPLDWTKDGIYKVYRVNDDGTLTDMNAYRQGSHMVFETDHFSIYVIVDVSEKSEADEPEIPDVPTEPDTSDCNCICHAKDIIKRFIAIIYKFVIELLGIEHICDCGVAHY